MPDIDRHPGLGRRRTLSSFEDCLDAVRAVWPDACAHGSTGIERCWTVGEGDDRRLIAHHWSPGSKGIRYHLRIADPASPPVWWL